MTRKLTAGFALLLCLGLSCGIVPRRGPELSNDQLNDPDAHQWSDADARTALWFTRNFPDDFAALGFLLYNVPTYNQHDERYGFGPNYRADGATGRQHGGFFKNTPSDYFALIDDPQLRVKMISLEARERNRMREAEQRRHAGTWPYDASSAPDPSRDPGRMDDTEVEQRLMDQYR